MAQPEQRFKVGPCVASVFTNEVVTTDGNRVLRNVALQKLYKDKAGEFRYTTSFGTNDLPKAILALMKAYNYLVSSDQPSETE